VEENITYKGSYVSEFPHRENALKLHRELDLLRAQVIENDRQHEEEVVRLRTELRMARRHEEFLSKGV
jgi:hypothetical protein